MSETEFVETVCSDDGSVARFRTCNRKCTSKKYFILHQYSMLLVVLYVMCSFLNNYICDSYMYIH